MDGGRFGRGQGGKGWLGRRGREGDSGLAIVLSSEPASPSIPPWLLAGEGRRGLGVSLVSSRGPVCSVQELKKGRLGRGRSRNLERSESRSIVSNLSSGVGLLPSLEPQLERRRRGARIKERD